LTGGKLPSPVVLLLKANYDHYRRYLIGTIWY